MIKHPSRYREQTQREWRQWLRQLRLEDAIRMTEEILSCGLLEQVQLRADDQPRSLWKLLHERRRT